MREYLRDTVVTLYQAFCQPRALAERAGGMDWIDRGLLLGSMCPLLLVVACVGAGGAWVILKCAGQATEGVVAGTGVVLGVLSGVGLGVVLGVEVGVTLSVSLGIGLGTALGIGAAVGPGTVFGVGLGLALGGAWGVALGVSGSRERWASMPVGLGVTAVLTSGAAANVVWGRDVGVAVGVSSAFALVAGYFRVEWYAVDVAGTLWQLLQARRHPDRARALLRRSPVYWREPIWLPLAGLKALLVLASRQEYSAGVEECLSLIAARPRQARVARAAVAETTARYLVARGTVKEIAQAFDRLGWWRERRVKLPPALDEALAEFDEIARYAGQYVGSRLLHNRRRALETMRDRAERAAHMLGVVPGRLAGMLAATARTWDEVARDVLEATEQAREKAGFLYNPFVFGQPIEETETNLFVGRRDIVRDIEVSLSGGAQKTSLVLWGPRRMGKTSVLMQLPRLLGPEFVPTFVDVQAADVRECIGAFFRRVSDAVTGALRRRRVEPDSLPSQRLMENPFGAFADWLARVEGKLGDNRHLLLCLDEYERIEASIVRKRITEDLMDHMRHIIQHHPRVVVLLAGSHRPDEMELNWPDVLISTKLIRVSYLQEEEARKLIAEPVADFGVSYAEGSVERVLEVTRCQPNLVQAVCYELVNHLNMEERREARRDDVDRAVEQALESAHLYFAETWGQLSERQKGVLEAIANAGDSAEPEEVAHRIGVAREQAEAELRTLESRSVVEAVDERWRFQVAMVGEWVRRQSG